METKDIHKDVHGSARMTGWVHHHRRLAVWLMKILIAGVAYLLYYLRRQEKEIELEEKKTQKY